MKVQIKHNLNIIKNNLLVIVFFFKLSDEVVIIKIKKHIYKDEYKIKTICSSARIIKNTNLSEF